MYHPRICGDFYEIGYKYGFLLRNKIAFTLPPISSELYEFGLQSYHELGYFYPELVHEIKGFADGILDTPQNVGAFMLSLPLSGLRGQCSVFAYKNPDNVIVGRNYDMPYQFRNITESSLIAPTDKYAHISQSDIFIGRSDGINEKGLFVAMSFVNGVQVQPGISFHFIIRKVLEECETTDHAVEVISNAKVSTSNNFLIADRRGTLAVVESAPAKSVVRYPGAGENFIFITNQFVSDEMQALDKGAFEWSKSKERFSAIDQRLKACSQMDLTSAREILSDKCVCLNLKKERFGTIWSVVADLNALSIERAEGNPGVANFKVEARLERWLNRRHLFQWG